MSLDPYAADARCHRCNTNVDDWRHLASAPCPTTTELEFICAACCAESDSSCTDCLSVLVAHIPPRARHDHDDPQNSVVVMGTDAATATASQILPSDAPTVAVAAPVPHKKDTA